MSRRILVPWAMPEIGREVLKKAKAEIIFLHGPKGELPTPKEIIKGISNVDIFLPSAFQSVPREMIMVIQIFAELPILEWGITILMWPMPQNVASP